jgi:hypothetical protein
VCIDTLQKGGNWFQITYRALNIIWLCSLSSPSNPVLLSKPLAQILADLLKREERKEKVIRMAVSILCNLSSQAKFLDMVLPLGILRSVQQNLLRVWSDTDVEELLKSLQAKLQAHVDGKGTWDEYTPTPKISTGCCYRFDMSSGTAKNFSRDSWTGLPPTAAKRFGRRTSTNSATMTSWF